MHSDSKSPPAHSVSQPKSSGNLTSNGTASTLLWVDRSTVDGGPAPTKPADGLNGLGDGLNGLEKSRGPPPFLEDDEDDDLSQLEQGWPQEDPPDVQLMRQRLTLMANFNSDDYDVQESDVYRELILGTTQKQYQLENITAWTLSVIIGLINGCFGAAFNLAINQLNSWKYDSMSRYLTPGGGWAKPYLIMMAFSFLYSAVAGVLGSYVSPQAAGSGIPEIRAYLNGIHITNLLSIRTLIAKSLGVSFAIASGLVAGKEGPFIHIGAILGAGVSKRGSLSVTRWTGGKLRARLRGSLGQYFKQPVETRDYVAAGAAAGISTAFGAPIGGVLFAIEQGSSWFSTRMVWHAVVAAGVALYVTVILLESYTDPSAIWYTQLAEPLEFVFKLSGSAGKADAKDAYYFVSWEVLVFMVMGAIGGVLGALLVPLNRLVWSYRVRWVRRSQPTRRVLEVMFLACLTTTIWFFISYTSPCADRPLEHPNAETTVTDDLGDRAILPQLWCDNPDQYSTRGAFFLQPLSGAVSRLYYSRIEQGQGDVFVYESAALGLLFMLIYLLIPFTYGSGAASGVFVPTLVAGAAGGRLLSKGIRSLLAHMGVDPGTLPVSGQSYAVVGSAALLGGVTRMTLSSIVLIMETSGAGALVVPLIAATVVAKIVADQLCVGLYDTTILRNAYPFLPAEPTDLEQMKLQQQLTCSDVMTPSPECMPAIIKIRDLVHMLRTTTFNTFPLVALPVPGVPQGTSQLAGNSSVPGSRAYAPLSAYPSMMPSTTPVSAPAAPGPVSPLATVSRRPTTGLQAGTPAASGAPVSRVSLRQYTQVGSESLGTRSLQPLPSVPSGVTAPHHLAAGFPLSPSQQPNTTHSSLQQVPGAPVGTATQPSALSGSVHGGGIGLHVSPRGEAAAVGPARVLTKHSSVVGGGTSSRKLSSLDRASHHVGPTTTNNPTPPADTTTAPSGGSPLAATGSGRLPGSPRRASSNWAHHEPPTLQAPDSHRSASGGEPQVSATADTTTSTGRSTWSRPIQLTQPYVRRNMSLQRESSTSALNTSTGATPSSYDPLLWSSGLYTGTSTGAAGQRGAGAVSARIAAMAREVAHSQPVAGMVLSAVPDSSGSSVRTPVRHDDVSTTLPAVLGESASERTGRPPRPFLRRSMSPQSSRSGTWSHLETTSAASQHSPPPTMPSVADGLAALGAAEGEHGAPEAGSIAAAAMRGAGQVMVVEAGEGPQVSASGAPPLPPTAPPSAPPPPSSAPTAAPATTPATTAPTNTQPADSLSPSSTQSPFQVATSQTTSPQSPSQGPAPQASQPQPGSVSIPTDASLSYMTGGPIQSLIQAAAARDGSLASRDSPFSFGTSSSVHPGMILQLEQALAAGGSTAAGQEQAGAGRAGHAQSQGSEEEAGSVGGGSQGSAGTDPVVASLNTSPAQDGPGVAADAAPMSPTQSRPAAVGTATHIPMGDEHPLNVAATPTGLPQLQLPAHQYTPTQLAAHQHTPFLAPQPSLLREFPRLPSGLTTPTGAGLATPSVSTVHAEDLGQDVGGVPSTLGVEQGIYSVGVGGGEVGATIVGVISRKTLLKILQVRVGFTASAQEAQGGVGGGVLRYPTALVGEVVGKLDVHPWKPPTSQEGQEALFRSLSEQELDSYINLRHYMQRVPFSLPCNASLSQAYRLFRKLGLHHMLVTTGDAPVVGVITRSDLVPDNAAVVMHEKLDRSLLEAEEEARILGGAGSAVGGMVSGEDGSSKHDRRAWPGGGTDGAVGGVNGTAGGKAGPAVAGDGERPSAGGRSSKATKSSSGGSDPAEHPIRRKSVSELLLPAVVRKSFTFQPTDAAAAGADTTKAAGPTSSSVSVSASRSVHRVWHKFLDRLRQDVTDLAGVRTTPRAETPRASSPLRTSARSSREAPRPPRVSLPSIESMPRPPPTTWVTPPPGTTLASLGAYTSHHVSEAASGQGARSPGLTSVGALTRGSPQPGRTAAAAAAAAAQHPHVATGEHRHGSAAVVDAQSAPIVPVAVAAETAPVPVPVEDRVSGGNARAKLGGGVSPPATTLSPSSHTTSGMRMGRPATGWRAARVAELKQRLDESHTTGGGAVEDLMAGTYNPMLQEETEALGFEARDYGMPLNSLNSLNNRAVRFSLDQSHSGVVWLSGSRQVSMGRGQSLELSALPTQDGVEPPPQYRMVGQGPLPGAGWAGVTSHPPPALTGMDSNMPGGLPNPHAGTRP